MSLIPIPQNIIDRAGHNFLNHNLSSPQYATLLYVVSVIMSKFEHDNYDDTLEISPGDLIGVIDILEISKKLKIKYLNVKKGLKKFESLEFLKILSWDEEKDLVKIKLIIEEKGDSK